MFNRVALVALLIVVVKCAQNGDDSNEFIDQPIEAHFIDDELITHKPQLPSNPPTTQPAHTPHNVPNKQHEFHKRKPRAQNDAKQMIINDKSIKLVDVHKRHSNDLIDEVNLFCFLF